MKKRFLSILLVLTLVMGIMPFSAINVSAADASHTVDASMAASRTNTLINSLVGKYFTTTQATCGNNICDKCKNSNVIGTTWLKNTMGLVPDSVSLLPEHYYSSTGCVTSTAWSCAGFANYCLWYIYAQNPSDNVRRVNIYTGAFNKSNMDGSGVRTGDVIRVDDHHSFVYISHDSSGVTVLDSNWDTSRHNLVQKHVISWSWRSGTTMAITRGKNWGTGTHTTCDKGTYVYYEAAHPHYKCYRCSVCGTVWRNTAEPTSVSTCSSCIGLIDTRYPTPFKAYTLKNANQPAYDSVNGNNIGNIYPSDFVTIQEVYTNGWVKANCPWTGYSSGRTIFAPLSTFLDTAYTPKTSTATTKTQCYYRNDFASSPGYVYVGDACVIVGKSGGYYCLLCPWNTGGYYLVWSSASAFVHTHSYSSWSKYDSSSHKRSCACGAVETASHTWGAAQVTTAATCTSAGVKQSACTVCGSERSESIPKLAHTYNQKNTASTYLKSAATCQQVAKYYYSCTCGAKGTTEFTSGSLGTHSYGSWKYADGNNHQRTCGVCSASETKAHAWSDPVYVESVMQNKQTCNGCGTEKYSSILEKIEIASKPNKVVYELREAFDSTGLTVKAIHKSGSSALVSGYTTSGFSSATAGEKTITVTYSGKTATFTVTVKGAAPEILYGDLNADGAVNKKDSLLMKMYLADNTTEIDKGTADVYADGEVNKKDSLLLKQYLAGLDVKLGA